MILSPDGWSVAHSSTRSRSSGRGRNEAPAFLGWRSSKCAGPGDAGAVPLDPSNDGVEGVEGNSAGAGAEYESRSGDSEGRGLPCGDTSIKVALCSVSPQRPTHKTTRTVFRENVCIGYTRRHQIASSYHADSLSLCNRAIPTRTSGSGRHAVGAQLLLHGRIAPCVRGRH